MMYGSKEWQRHREQVEATLAEHHELRGAAGIDWQNAPGIDDAPEEIMLFLLQTSHGIYRRLAELSKENAELRTQLEAHENRWSHEYAQQPMAAPGGSCESAV